MKVKEYIEQLRKLDPEKDLWILYDYCYALVPEVEEVTSDDEFIPDEIKEGDYIIKAC